MPKKASEEKASMKPEVIIELKTSMCFFPSPPHTHSAAASVTFGAS